MTGELVLEAAFPLGNHPASTIRSRSRPAPPPANQGRELLESSIDLIQQRLKQLGRRSGLPDHEAEEFCSWALFKLVEDDYRVLSSWQGRSSFSTYLTVVLVNLMRDYRTHLWGKWRPSAEARRQGAEAILLESVWMRDGLPLDEAIDHVRKELGDTLSRAELERVASRLHQRTPRRRVGEEELQKIGIDGRVEARVEDGERSRLASRFQALLIPLFRSLPAEDRLLLKLVYWDGLSMATISPLLGRPLRELYSLRDRCLKNLRRALKNAGLDAERAGASTEVLRELAAGLEGVWE